jgi:hypothetical protein
LTEFAGRGRIIAIAKTFAGADRKSTYRGRLLSFVTTLPNSAGWIELVREDAHDNRLPIDSQKFSIIQTLLSLVIPAMAMSRPFGAGTP